MKKQDKKRLKRSGALKRRKQLCCGARILKYKHNPSFRGYALRLSKVNFEMGLLLLAYKLKPISLNHAIEFHSKIRERKWRDFEAKKGNHKNAKRAVFYVEELVDKLVLQHRRQPLF